MDFSWIWYGLLLLVLAGLITLVVLYAKVHGERGRSGPSGRRGFRGVLGATGSAGVNGAPGATGNTGVTGHTGATGPAGVNGATGATGIAGVTGATGAQGATGSAGPVVIAAFDGTGGQTLGFGGNAVRFSYIHDSVASTWTTPNGGLTFNPPIAGTYLITYTIPVQIQAGPGTFNVRLTPTVASVPCPGIDYVDPFLISDGGSVRFLSGSFVSRVLPTDDLLFNLLNLGSGSIVLANTDLTGPHWAATLIGPY